jgi:hypothetical protein
MLVIPWSWWFAELLPCDPVDLLSWSPLTASPPSCCSLGCFPGTEDEPTELLLPSIFRRASRRRRLCISRRRQRSSSVSVGSELVRSSCSGDAGDGSPSPSPSPSPRETEQADAMDVERARRGRLASGERSVPKRPPRERPRPSSISSDSPPSVLPPFSAGARFPLPPPNTPRK